MKLSRAFTNLLDVCFGRRRTVNLANAVLLTFDDGPNADITPSVLDRLRDFQTRAVFFVVGNRTDGSVEILKRILAEGHLIGNHTYTHPLGRDPGPISYVRDVRRNQELLEQLTARPPRLFRAPMGRNSPGALISPRLLGLQQVLWSVDSEDLRLRTTAEAAARAEQLKNEISGGDIVLMHDDNQCALTMLDVLLPHLKSRGLDLHSAVETV
jgi:peptidoglycan/xylan/chitin deacetylase (PgdA/CDA1 family)